MQCAPSPWRRRQGNHCLKVHRNVSFLLVLVSWLSLLLQVTNERTKHVTQVRCCSSLLLLLLLLRVIHPYPQLIFGFLPSDQVYLVLTVSLPLSPRNY